MYDIIVVGGGPAGMTAALYGLRNGKTVLVIEKAGFGGQITHSPNVENYPGTFSMSGNEFAERTLDQILRQGAEIELETVTEVRSEADRKRVAGGGNSALQEAILLAGKCKQVVMLQDLPGFTGEARLQEVLFARENVKALTDVKITGLLTENGALTGVEIEGRSDGRKQTVPCDGLFVAIGLIPENEPFKALAELNEYGYFDSDEQCLTKTPGVFVAGDCRSKRIRQLTTAAADGATAALAACQYLDRL